MFCDPKTALKITIFKNFFKKETYPTIYKIHTSSIILNGERLSTIPSKIKKEIHSCPSIEHWNRDSSKSK